MIRLLWSTGQQIFGIVRIFVSQTKDHRSHCKKFRTDETRNDRLENQSSIVNSVFSNTGIVWKHLNSPILFILWIVVSSLQTQFVVEGYNYFPKGGRINTHHQLHSGKCQIKGKIFAVLYSESSLAWWWYECWLLAADLYKWLLTAAARGLLTLMKQPINCGLDWTGHGTTAH